MCTRSGAWLLVCLLIFAVVGVQTTTVAADSLHRHSSQHCCGFCHTGPLSLAGPPAGVPAIPALAQSREEQPLRVDAVREIPVRLRACRAPPAGPLS